MPNIAYTPDCGFHLIIWREDEIFPLKKIKFEGIEFDAPNNYDII
ncbi:lipooligosaccharide cholinephosphotransferase [Fusobacterium animalis ATCC 51191]|uniref:Lipooligosaccharide cholinephosphotransferase n=1 Tax=Fusobacterium animalis ATCC 51191 TaxID=997347 RepID=F9ELX8_9FUSO|nr:lipooligosaccharide cholinephosphotransferase [Fusobacterium animalis ATCC 51191]